MAKEHGAEHDLLRQAPGLGLDHEDGVLGTGDDQVQVAVGTQADDGGVEDIFTVLVAHPRGGDGAVEGRAGDGQGRRGADHGRHLRVDGGIEGLDRGDDLHLAAEALGEEGTDGPIDKARGEDLVLARAPLAAEEAAGDAARGVGLLLIVHGQGQEVLDLGGTLVDDHGHQDHGVIDVDQHGAIGLAGDLARLQGHGLGAELEGFFDGSHWGFLGAGAGRDAGPEWSGLKAPARSGPTPNGLPPGGTRGLGPRWRAELGGEHHPAPARGVRETAGPTPVIPASERSPDKRLSDADPGDRSARDSGPGPCP